VKSFDFISLWSPELSPLEVFFRATAVYVFIQLLFRLVGRKEPDVLLAHVREKGKESLADVKDAFLERSGKVTVVLREQRS
jgi:uncharacterized membrane protein YcaP (DUF421 family)